LLSCEQVKETVILACSHVNK